MSNAYKPLFNNHLLRARMKGFRGELSGAQRQALNAWVRAAKDGSLRGVTERALHGKFLDDVFDKLLGYRQSVGHVHFHMRVDESSKEVAGGARPDGLLGFYVGGEAGQTRVVIELKAPGADLEAKQAGYGGITPVEQAFRYVTRFDDCRWVIVSNFETVRLYSKTRGQGHYHEFKLAELGTEDALRTFLFLLSCRNLIADTGKKSLIDALAAETHIQEQEITKRFYAFYKEVRVRLFRRLVADNPAPADTDPVAHETFLLEKAQKILDRVLFICFCEDTGLLPPWIIRKALEAAGTGFVLTSRWQQMCGLFNSIDKGNPPLGISGYNGGLFQRDEALEALAVGDETLDDCLRLSEYDFETDLNVNILGHVFEQSIFDLESFRADIRGEDADAKKGKRKKEGVFYTPEFITQFIVENTVGSWLQERFEELKEKHLNRIFEGRGKKKMMRQAELAMWLEYQDVLRNIKILDPACGSGAFLVAAFDYLHTEYNRANDEIARIETGKGPGLFDLDRQILQQNLFGVDINPESVEITKLSLWLKTARKDKPLNNLDGNVKCGNSIVAPPSDNESDADREVFAGLPEDVRSKAFDWRTGFPAVAVRGGFDCVIGNPPYVRQELLSPIKLYLQRHYRSYHGMADLYVYFYERGVQALAPGGKLSFIVTNKWLRSGYGEALRGFLATSGVLENIVDFGHAPIFEDADTFPCIIGYKKVVAAPPKPTKPAPSAPVIICPMPRDALGTIGVNAYVAQNSYAVPWSRFTADAWSLENPAVEQLLLKMEGAGTPLGGLAGVSPAYGIKTGRNEAFVVDSATRNLLVQQDSRSVEVLVPVLRGQDIKRWHSNWFGTWMVLLKSSADHCWPWSGSGAGAEAVFEATYPALHGHMKGFEHVLRARSDQGRFWWELRPCDYYELFDRPRIIHADITWRPEFSECSGKAVVLNTAYIWPTDDRFLLATVNSPVMWYYMWRRAPHGKDDALRLIRSFVSTLPIPCPSERMRAVVQVSAERLVGLTGARQSSTRELLDWLRIEFGIEKPGQKLTDFSGMDSDDFVSEVRKRMPKGTRLSPAVLAEIRSTFDEYAVPMRERRGEALQLERRISDLVNDAYGLTPEEIDLMWKTAPPRMPIQTSGQGSDTGISR